ncbi:TatD family hydrolase [Candidatus Peregrinibacteria bacterium]|nr:TatD family hydrolase [Candidatus Peregrinibacteria bacterium]
MLYDTHCHVYVREFDTDRDEVIKRSNEAGIRLIHVGFEPDGNEKAAVLAKQYNEYWTAGIHPHHANLATEKNLARIRELAKSHHGKRLKALGEMGLDFFKNHQPRDVQIQAFKAQLKLALELNLPVIIHCRDAFQDALKMLDTEKIINAVFHCFAGTLDEAQQCWSRGYLTSFTGICTYPKAENVRAVIKKAPIDRIMIESDCPFLAPQSHRGQRNEPSFLQETFKKICEIRAEKSDILEAILEKNTERFFNIPRVVRS